MSESAEMACRSIMYICADWEPVARSIDEEDRTSLARIADSDFLSSSESAQCLSYLARLVSQGESFTFGRIRNAVESHVAASGSPMLLQLYEKNRNSLDSTWDSALSALRDWLSVDLRGVTSWERVKFLIELRNAAAHGGGRFTERQRKNLQQFEKIKKEIRNMGYEVKGGRIIVFRGAIRKEARSLCAFIQEVDDLTRALCSIQ
ncbi:hypothetical protein [Streptomyces pseudovenezuelae]|uniref:hypothetical protein n=1 Tax=Streptomyces pseudovenezuelae TaxID=67350 RepID=UPI0037101450